MVNKAWSRSREDTARRIMHRHYPYNKRRGWTLWRGLAGRGRYCARCRAALIGLPSRGARVRNEHDLGASIRVFPSALAGAQAPWGRAIGRSALENHDAPGARWARAPCGRTARMFSYQLSLLTRAVSRSTRAWPQAPPQDRFDAGSCRSGPSRGRFRFGRRAMSSGPAARANHRSAALSSDPYSGTRRRLSRSGADRKAWSPADHGGHGQRVSRPGGRSRS